MSPECCLCPGLTCHDHNDEFGDRGSVTLMDTNGDDELVFQNDWKIADCVMITFWKAMEMTDEQLVKLFKEENEKHPANIGSVRNEVVASIQPYSTGGKGRVHNVP